MTSLIVPHPTVGGLAAFASRGGQLRVSFTPRCDLGCWFCHNEGETPPRITHADRAIQPRPRAMTAANFITAINGLAGAGLRRVFFTGGEPLLSPLTRPVLEGLPTGSARPYSTTLITNGLRLVDNLPWLSKTGLDRVKVSLHYFSDDSIREIAEGKPGDIAKIKAGIEASVGVFREVELNLLLQEQNRHEVPEIIDYACHLGVNVQIIELVDTEHNAVLGVLASTPSGSARVFASWPTASTSAPPEPGRASACSASGRPPSRSSTRPCPGITSASAPPAPSSPAASRASGPCAWTPPALSCPASCGPTCAWTSPTA